MDDLYFLKLIKLRIELEFPTEGCEFFLSLRNANHENNELIPTIASDNNQRIHALKSVHRELR